MNTKQAQRRVAPTTPDEDLVLIPEPHVPSERQPFEVCSHCAGHGFVVHPALDGITSAQLDEWYRDDLEAREGFMGEYNTRGGAYDVRCQACEGQRVVRALCCCDDCEKVRRSAWEDEEVTRQELAFGC